MPNNIIVNSIKKTLYEQDFFNTIITIAGKVKTAVSLAV